MTRNSVHSWILCAAALVVSSPPLQAQGAKPFDAAAAFGARVDIEGLRLSPDGTSVAFITPIAGQGGAVYTQKLAPGAKPMVAFYANGKPMRMNGCNWVSNDRLVCGVFGLVHGQARLALAGLLPVSRLQAVNSDGTKLQPLETPQRPNTYGFALTDAAVVDWLPDQDGSVLMARLHVANAHINTKIGTDDRPGVGVDVVDTRTGLAKPMIAPRYNAVDYISDGRGTVRIVAESSVMAGDSDKGVTDYLYRMQGSEDWHELGRYSGIDKTGFRPVAVDHDLNVAYGWKKLDGRMALYTMSLDGSNQEKLVFARPDVDLDSLVRIGRRNRVVGVSYTTDRPVAEYFDPEIKKLVADLHQALPKQPLISIVDSSVDENKLLIYASGDNDSGAYYILDRQARSLRKFFSTRAPLDGVTLAHVRPIKYPAADGEMIPGYLTLPPGVDNPHGLPAIVMPHGGPNARDTWGFDWLAQFFAARGYVVLQPEFRGSAGFGDSWFLHNGFQSWDVAIGDVVSAGRWLASSGLADASKVGVVGWSYGGYAALQSAVVDSSVFKAVVAIAPVTDLSALVNERGFWGNYFETAEFVGGGQHMRDGSPINHVDKIKVPVLLFHGTADRNVSADESRRMADALKAAGAKCDLVLYEDHDHSLEDSEVRADMLRKSDAFLRQAFGIPTTQ